MSRQEKPKWRQGPQILRVSAAVAILAGGYLTAPALAEAPNPAETKANVRCSPDSKPRYHDNGDGTVCDGRTGLLWLKDAGCQALGPTGEGRGTFKDANAAAAALLSGRCGLADGSKPGDWRLPTREEWLTLLNPLFKNPAIGNADGTGKWRPGDAFMNVRSAGYWSSTSDPEASSYAWGAGLFGGVIASARKSDENFIWPVRKP